MAKPTPIKAPRRRSKPVVSKRDETLIDCFIEELLAAQEAGLKEREVYTYQSPYYGCSGAVRASSALEAEAYFEMREESSHKIERTY